MVGRLDGSTNTTIGSDCYTGQDKIYNGIAWIVLHEVKQNLNQSYCNFQKIAWSFQNVRDFFLKYQ